MTKQEYQKRWHKDNHYRYRDTCENKRLLYTYGITLLQYKELYNKQGGLCAICHKPETAKHKSGCLCKLSVDHCHITKKVRGLLCLKCNTRLGMLEDIEFITHARLYLGTVNE